MSFLLLFSFYFLFRIPVPSLVLYASSLMRPLSAFALTFIGLSSMEHTVSWSNQMKKCKYQHWIINDWSWGESQCFPRMKSGKTLRFEGNEIHCPSRDQTSSYLLCSKTKQIKANFEKQNIRPPSSNLVPRAHVPFGRHQDTELWNNQFPETKILGLPATRRMCGFVYMASRDEVDVDTFHRGIQYALEKLRKVEIWLWKHNGIKF